MRSLGGLPADLQAMLITFSTPPAAALQAMSQASHTLSVQMFGKRPHAEIAQSIQSRRGCLIHDFQGANITVIRGDWPSGKGYELQVVFEARDLIS